MQRPAEDFGDAGIVRFYCDGCSKPLHVCYQGVNGQYCSRACLDSFDNRKVKAPEPLKVKLAQSEKVKINGVAKVKTAQASPLSQKVKIAPRNQQRIRRRAAIRRIRREIMTATDREPTISEVQDHLTPLGLRASVRTVWKQLCEIRNNGIVGARTSSVPPRAG